MKIFLDDIRNPQDCVNYMHKRIGALNPIYLEKWVVVRNYEQFVDIIANNINIITHVSFDHDLGEDVAQKLVESGLTKRQARKRKKEVLSGYDCAKWMKNFYIIKNKQLPVMFVHSMNPVGTENIINLFK